MPPDRKPEGSIIRRALEGSALSQSCPSTTLAQALQNPDLDLNMSCFPAISLEKGAIDDDELTNLNWLHSSDVLKSVNVETGGGLCGSPTREMGGTMSPLKPSNHTTASLPTPADIPYDAHQHRNSKPPYSFSCLIFMAIEDSPSKRLPVKEIYNWILEHFPYFVNAPTGWKNSVRHNLSLNKCFKKVEKEKGQSIGKGSLWMIDPAYRPNLLQALKKTPIHPYHHIFTTPPPSPQQLPHSGTGPYPTGLYISNNGAAGYHPQAYPFQRLSTPENIDPDSEVDAAQAMMTLKSGGASSHAEAVRMKGERHWTPASLPNVPGFRTWTPHLYRPGNGAINIGGEHSYGHTEGKVRCHHVKWKLQERVKRRHRHRHRRRRSPLGDPIVSKSPSEDHNYSCNSSRGSNSCSRSGSTSPTSSIDGPYEYGNASDSDSYRSDESSDYDDEEMEHDGRVLRKSLGDSGFLGDEYGKKEPGGGDVLPKKRPHELNLEDEDDLKLVQGADALLNLAGIKTASIIPLRTISPMGSENSMSPKPAEDPNHPSSDTPPQAKIS
ncbi:forkhead box protein N3-like isoform X2 [Branchiostoma floridae]|uniref:Forkhead box protein G1 n=1 Tax=Branchiostoma floridae TaxID=7739 RepID=A0A9J7NAJ0_BRAFL|nr:forkhead box protein N3-like isoform X2 [Branchiostoma floridae]